MEEKPFQNAALLTYSEAANILAISIRTIHRMIGRGTLVVVRPTPKTPRLRFKDVEDLVQAVPREDSAPDSK